ncbi:2-polyprenyl-3-methyl-5-hydroxy-6-metoxy-1,4-benzoquinol methylase [Sphingomonas sp. PP-CE-1A-559]|jgi:SAM-dependent methyltransferase|uniref:methyltransferase domain-containing protein n=1 Tax=Sphingomonas sp. PP-CE-1A-559 TaxID=2135657 RepID=UPI00105649E9|nr:methyltransferase domain-containing protein [Sphingomonas sp. PP-CE-1A-559]TCP91592.1 2-polyprenyl-3-methyl-5-hydroxy-6-metoxy-1,4-benzoquinol methylase [Sphingomonas sp. PP-CE-1A-559]
MSLAVRSQAEELMDADDLDAATYADVVGDLATVNTVTMARRPTLDFLARATAGRKSFRLLDVGFGDGDMLRRIARWAKAKGIKAELVGVDLNPRSEQAARAHGGAIRYVTGDYADLAHEPWDVIVSSLVAHHMSHDQLIAFLRFMEGHASAGWFVNDLHRHGFAHWGFPVLATIARWHPIVRHDGTLSIARSYCPDEWPPLLAEAGITEAKVRRVFPFRLCVERLR